MKRKSYGEQITESLAECDKKGIPYLDDMGKTKMPYIEDKTVTAKKSGNTTDGFRHTKTDFGENPNRYTA